MASVKRSARLIAEGDHGNHQDTKDAKEEKDEGRRMKDETTKGRPSAESYILHPSSFILHPSSFILHPSSFILQPSPFVSWWFHFLCLARPDGRAHGPA